MGRSIMLETPLKDPHQESVENLEQAPAQHAEALLELFEVLEGLHRCGMLTVARGSLAAGNALVEKTVDAIDSPQVMRGFRNLIAMARVVGSLDTEIVQSFAKAAEEAAREPESGNPCPSTLSLLAQLRSSDARRGLAFASRFAVALGRQMRERKKQRQSSDASCPKAA